MWHTTSQPGYMGNGIIDQVVTPEQLFRIKFSGSYWSAKTINPYVLHPGDFVRVIGRQSITLLVEPISD